MKYIKNWLQKPESKNIMICFIVLLMLWTVFGIEYIIMQSTIVHRLGIKYYAYLYVLSFFVSIGAYFGSFKLKKYFDIKSIYFFSLLVYGTILTLSFFLIHSDNVSNSFPRLISFFLIIVIGIGLHLSFLITLHWALIYQIFRPHVIEKFMPVYTIASIIGGVIAGFLVQIVVNTFGVAYLVILSGSLLLISAWFIFKNYIMSISLLKTIPYQENKKLESSLTKLKSEIYYFSNNPLSFLFIISHFFDAFCFCLINYEFIYTVNQLFSVEKESSLFLGNYSIAVCGFTFLFSLVYKNKLVSKLGTFNSLSFFNAIFFLGFAFLSIDNSPWNILIFRFIAVFFVYMIITPTLPMAVVVIHDKYRQSARLLTQAFYILGTATAGLLLVLINVGSFTFVFTMGTVVALCNLVITVIASSFYTKTLVKNMSDKTMLDDSLDVLLETNNKSINNVLKNILLSQDDVYTTSDKIKVLNTIKRLNNFNLLLTVILLVDHENWEVRAVAIDTLSSLLYKIKDRMVVDYWMNCKMLKIIKDEQVDIVRNQAAKLLLDHSPKNTLPKIFIDILQDKNDHEGRLIVFQALRNARLAYGELIELEGLDDADPMIRGEAASFLWKYCDYKKKCENVLHNLLLQSDKNSILSGLNAICLIKVNDFLYHETERFLHDKDDMCKILSNIIHLQKMDANNVNRLKFIEEIINTLLESSQIQEKEWKKIISILIDTDQELIIDDILSALQTKASLNSIIKNRIQFLAELMNKKMTIQAYELMYDPKINS